MKSGSEDNADLSVMYSDCKATERCPSDHVPLPQLASCNEVILDNGKICALNKRLFVMTEVTECRRLA